MGVRNRNVASVISFFCLLLSCSMASATCEKWAAKIASVQGKVEAKRANTSNWQTAKLDDTFCPGDQIRVNTNSRAAIILVNETLLRLDQNSAIKFTTIKPRQASLIELLKGIGHFISRVPRSLKIETPTMNAAIEGTEFVIAVLNNESRITVFEGTVLASNKMGQLRLTSGDSAVASQHAAPQKRLLAKPRDAVQWALYYPPVFDPNLKKSDPVYQAAAKLNTGRVKEASRLLKKSPNTGNSKALQAIIAVVNNDKTTALILAKEAVRLAPDSAATHIALSYAHQAHFDLEQALQSALVATSKETNNALAWARVAELLLSTGELDDALSAAQKASSLNDKLSRTQTILGYAHLLQIDIDAAKQAFEQAIKLDQTDPLPRLGLGLAKIRTNDLTEGRREIEIAASLDPNNAIVRSYLGKAYFEEKRSPLDTEQFDMAKALDPNDPTPWFYDAIAKQTENRPVEALESLQKSIELNDNRAVYRSSLQLDQDEAARSASLGRIYQDLRFEQLALVEGWKSVSTDPSNHSSHRLLADSYASLPRHEVARVSELLQSQLLQPLNTNPIQPQLAQSDLGVQEGAGPANLSLNEFNALFTRDSFRFQADGISGSNNTEGGNIMVSGLLGNTAVSFGQYNYSTDGYRKNNDLKHDILNAFFQFDFSPNISLQFEARQRKSEFGDRDQSIDGSFDEVERREIDTDSQRLGYHHRLSTNSDFILSAVSSNETDISHFETNVGIVFPFPEPLIVNLDTTTEQDSSSVEAQYLYHSDNYNIVSGAGHFSRDRDRFEISTVTSGGATISETETTLKDKRQNNNYYLYAHFNAMSDLTLIFGAAYDDFNSETITDREEFSPKLGVIATPGKNTTIRFAAFKSLSRATLNTQTIEPTNVAGFNQFFDDFDGTVSERYGSAIDYKFTQGTTSGIELTRRKMTVPITGVDVEQAELLHRIYFSTTLAENSSLGVSYIFDRFESQKVIPTQPDKVRTQSLPIYINYYLANGLFTGIQTTGVDQEVRLTNMEYHETFWVTDIWMGYRFPNRAGTVSLMVKNIFDKEFKYQDRNFQTSDPVVPPYEPEQTIYINLTLAF